MPEVRTSKRSLGLRAANSDPNGPGGARIKETRATVPQGNSTRGFTPPGAKKAGGNGRAIEGVRKTAVPRRSSK